MGAVHVMYDKDCSVLDGKIESVNLTRSQKNYAEILSQLGKIAKYVEMRSISMWVEKPNGYKEMLNALEKDGKAYDNLTPSERAEYDKKYRYEKITGQRIGGAQIFLQHMIMEAHQDKEVKKVWDDMLNEIKLIASKEATEYTDGRDDTDLK